MRQALTITLLVTMLVACGGREERADANTPAAPAATAAAPSQFTPEQLGELGAQINRQPDRANELLAQHGLTAESFEQQIRKITESPEASKKYAEAYKRTKA